MKTRAERIVEAQQALQIAEEALKGPAQAYNRARFALDCASRGFDPGNSVHVVETWGEECNVIAVYDGIVTAETQPDTCYSVRDTEGTLHEPVWCWDMSRRPVKP